MWKIDKKRKSPYRVRRGKLFISKKQYIKTDKLLTYLLGLNGKAVNKYYLFY